jgi:hypothetical protein
MTGKEKLEQIRQMDVINMYHLNKSSFPPELVEQFERNYDVLYYMFNVFVPVAGDLPDLVRELMYKQFPSFRKETRPTIVEALDSIVNAAGVDLIQTVGVIMHGKSEGKTARDIFKPFDQWVKNHTYPEDTWEKVRDRERIEFGALDYSDKRWKEIKKEENKFRQLEIKWIQKRRFEYIDLLQTTFLKYFKGFEMLDADDLTVYSRILRIEYEDYNDYCQDIERFIDWGLEEEDFKLNFSERMQKEIAMGNEKRWEMANMRYRRVYGEEI